MGARKPTPPSAVKLPELIAIPPTAASKLCSCGVRFWWVEHNGARVPVACPTSLDTKAAGAVALPTRAPTPGAAGYGINHYIDCADRKRYGSAAKRAAAIAEHVEPPLERDALARNIAAAEALAERLCIRCTGAPGLARGETCGGFAVIAFNLDGRLFATPCSAHADAVLRALKLDRRASFTIHALEDFATDRGERVARAFIAKAANIRAWTTTQGFAVPRAGRTGRTL